MKPKKNKKNKINKSARKKIKDKIKFIKKSQGRKPLIPSSKVIPDKSREKIRKNKYNNEIQELLKEQEEEL